MDYEVTGLKPQGRSKKTLSGWLAKIWEVCFHVS